MAQSADRFQLRLLGSGQASQPLTQLTEGFRRAELASGTYGDSLRALETRTGDMKRAVADLGAAYRTHAAEISAASGDIRRESDLTAASVTASAALERAAIDSVTQAYLGQAAAARLARDAAGVGSATPGPTIPFPGRERAALPPAPTPQSQAALPSGERGRTDYGSVTNPIVVTVEGSRTGTTQEVPLLQGAGAGGRSAPGVGSSDSMNRIVGLLEAQAASHRQPQVLPPPPHWTPRDPTTGRFQTLAASRGHFDMHTGPGQGFTRASDPLRHPPAVRPTGGAVEVHDRTLADDFRAFAAYARSRAGRAAGSGLPGDMGPGPTDHTVFVDAGGHRGGVPPPPPPPGPGGGGGGNWWEGARNAFWGDGSSGRMRIPFTRMRVPFMGAGFGTLGMFAGLGPERMLMSAGAVAGSAGLGAAGAGMLGLGAAGQMAVGGGADAAVMKSTIADTKQLGTAYEKLQTAVAVYGAGSKQAAVAQAELNQKLKDLGPAAGAELQLAKNVQDLNKAWDVATAGARKNAVAILQQVVDLGSAYVPRVARAAQENLGIINTGLRPLFAWLKGPEGVGVFNNLENNFKRNLPTSVHAFTQGIELLLKLMSAASNRTGNFTQKIDQLLTRWNQKPNDQLQSFVDRLIGDFRMWENLIHAAGRALYDLFKNDAGLGKGIVVTLTDMLNKLDAWERSTSGRTQIHNIFALHKAETLELLKVLFQLGSAFTHLYLAIAPPLVTAMTGVLKVFTAVLGAIEKLGSMSPILNNLLVVPLGALLVASKAFGATKVWDAIRLTAASMGILGKSQQSEALAANEAAAANERLNRTVQSAPGATRRGTSSAASTLAAGGMTKLGDIGPVTRTVEEETKAAARKGMFSGMKESMQKGAGWAVLGTLLSQGIGDSVKGGVGTAISNLGTGASIGFMFGPWGAAVGAAIGAILTPGIRNALRGAIGASKDATDQGKAYANSWLKGWDGAPAALHHRLEQLGKEVAQARPFNPRTDFRTIPGMGHEPAGYAAQHHIPLITTTDITGFNAQQLERRNEALAQAGRVQAQALNKGWQQYKFQDEGTMFQQLRDRLKHMAPESRAAAAQSAISMANELVKQGKLSRRDADKLVKDIEAAFPGLKSSLGRNAREAANAFNTGLNLTRAKDNLHKTMRDMRADFPTVTAAMDRTKGDMLQKSYAMIQALRDIARHGSGPARREALRDIALLQGGSKRYLEAMQADTAQKMASVSADIAHGSKVATREARQHYLDFQHDLERALAAGEIDLDTFNRLSAANLRAFRESIAGGGMRGAFEAFRHGMDSIIHPTTNMTRAIADLIGRLPQLIGLLGQASGMGQSLGAAFSSLGTAAGLVGQAAHGMPPGPLRKLLTGHREGGYVQQLAGGGMVVPGDHKKDGTLILASGKEVLLTADGQKKMEAIHPGLLKRIVGAQLPHFQGGGAVGHNPLLHQLPGAAGVDPAHAAATAGHNTGTALAAPLRAGMTAAGRAAMNALSTSITTGSRQTITRTREMGITVARDFQQQIGLKLPDTTTRTFKKIDETVQRSKLVPQVKQQKNDVEKHWTQLHDNVIQTDDKLTKKLDDDGQKQYRQAIDHYTKLRDDTKKRFDDMYSQTSSTTQKMSDVVSKNTSAAAASGTANFNKLEGAIASAMNAGVAVTAGGVTGILDDMNAALGKLGAASAKVSIPKLTKSAGAAKKAVGGWIGKKGERGIDQELIMAGRGEAILNHPQQQVVDAALAQQGIGGLDELFKKVKTPHFMSTGGFVGGFRQMASGGWVRTGATIDPTGGQTGDPNMTFAELLEAGTNAGMRPDLTQLLGLPRGQYGMPMGTGIDIRAVGSKHSYVIRKNDVGSGQAGNVHFTIDLHPGIASALGWGNNADVEVAPVGTDPNAQVTTGPGAASAAAVSWTPLNAPKVTGTGMVHDADVAALKKVVDAANKYGQAHMPTTGPGGGAAYQGYIGSGGPAAHAAYLGVLPVSRTDQGVDFTGSGNVLAVAPGTVMTTNAWPSWPGTGQGVVYSTAHGNVYAVENVTPLVHAGQQVKAGDPIVHVNPGYPWLETGWANQAGTGPATPYNGAADGTAMPGGLAFRKFIGFARGGPIPQDLSHEGRIAFQRGLPHYHGDFMRGRSALADLAAPLVGKTARAASSDPRYLPRTRKAPASKPTPKVKNPKHKKPTKPIKFPGLKRLVGFDQSLLGEINDTEQFLSRLGNWQGYIDSLHQRDPVEALVTMADGQQIVNWNGMLDPETGHMAKGINARLKEIGDPGQQPFGIPGSIHRNRDQELGIDAIFLDKYRKEKRLGKIAAHRLRHWLRSATRSAQHVKNEHALIDHLMDTRDGLATKKGDMTFQVEEHFRRARHNLANRGLSGRYHSSQVTADAMFAIAQSERQALAGVPVKAPGSFIGDNSAWYQARAYDRANIRTDAGEDRKAVQDAARKSRFKGSLGLSNARFLLSEEEAAAKNAIRHNMNAKRAGLNRELRTERARLKNDEKFATALDKVLNPNGFKDQLNQLVDPMGSLQINIDTKKNIDIPNLLQEIADLKGTPQRLSASQAQQSATDRSAAQDALNQQLAQELAVARSQYDVLKKLPAFGGSFAEGGVVPGPMGEPRTIIAHGGETVNPPNVQPQIVIEPAAKNSWLTDFVDFRVKRVTTGMVRGATPRLPGRGGGPLASVR